MKKICVIAALIFLSAMVYPQGRMQQVIASSGGCKSAPGGSWYMGWTLGETLVATWKSADGSMTISSGMQQKVMLTDVETIPGWNVKVVLYPNPVGTILSIKFDEPVDKTISLYLLDVNGNVILTKKVEQDMPETQIDMEAYPSGVYLLKLIEGVKTNTYKVVKL